MIFNKAIILSLATLTAAHPGHEAEERAHAIKSRDAYMSNKRALQSCAAKLEARGISARAATRRQETVSKFRKARGIPVDAPLIKRSTASVLATDHEGDIEGIPAIANGTVS